MKSAVKLLVSGFGLLIGTQAFAAAKSNVLLWTDKKGFTAPTADCRPLERETTPFRVATLNGNALVRLHGDSRAKPSQFARVGEISRSELFSRKDDRDEKDLAKSSLKDLADYVVEIKNGAPVAKIRDGVKTVGSHLQIVMKDDRYSALYCVNRETTYYLFNVHVKEKTEPVAVIGVGMWETALLRSAQVRTAQDAEKAIEEQDDATAANGAGSTKTEKTGTPAAKSSSAATDSAAATAAATKTNAAKPAAQAPTASSAVAPIVPHENDAPAAAATKPAAPAASLEYVVCVNESLQVRSKTLNNVLFTASRLEPVQPVQAWGSEKQNRVIGGKTYAFINVKFPKRAAGKNTGWIADAYVKLKAECALVKPEPKKDAGDAAASSRADANGISGLNDPKCCDFPTIKRPSTSYREGMRRFRAGRSGGRRLHAACDLYRVKGEQTVSIASGKVLRGPYYFYQGTYALEVQHSGGFIARYGEILGTRVDGVSAGKSVKAGQKLGYIGKVNSGCCTPMLHFELYSGTIKSNSLNGRNAFQRRADLMDPTKYLQKWEKAKFGESY